MVTRARRNIGSLEGQSNRANFASEAEANMLKKRRSPPSNDERRCERTEMEKPSMENHHFSMDDRQLGCSIVMFDCCKKVDFSRVLGVGQNFADLWMRNWKQRVVHTSFDPDQWYLSVSCIHDGLDQRVPFSNQRGIIYIYICIHLFSKIHWGQLLETQEHLLDLKVEASNRLLVLQAHNCGVP